MCNRVKCSTYIQTHKGHYMSTVNTSNDIIQDLTDGRLCRVPLSIRWLQNTVIRRCTNMCLQASQCKAFQDLRNSWQVCHRTKILQISNVHSRLLRSGTTIPSFITVGKWPLIIEILARFARTMAISVLHCFSNEIGMISRGEVLAGMTYRHISVKNHPLLMKFCTQQQILNLINVTWSKMKKLHWTDSSSTEHISCSFENDINDICSFRGVILSPYNCS